LKKQTTSLLVIMLLAFSLLAAVKPVSAHDDKNRNGFNIIGTISAVDTTAGSLTITPKKGGADVVLKVDSTTMISRNNQTATLADLKMGDLVAARYDPTTMLAIMIRARLNAVQVIGTISAVDATAGTVSITPKKGGPDVMVKVDSTTMITRNRLTATLADLQMGDRVVARYDFATMLALKINASVMLAHVEGTISIVDTSGSTVSITPKQGGPDVMLKVDSTTMIKRNHQPAALADLQVGDSVEARYNPGSMLAVVIDVETGKKSDLTALMGKISIVDTTGNTVSITPSQGGPDVMLKVDSTTKIELNDKPATLADLKVGDMVNTRYDPSSMLAASIEVDTNNKANQGELKGTISVVDTTGSTVSITPKQGGPDVMLKVDSATKIERNGQPATLADLVAGDPVEAAYDLTTMLASNIEAGTNHSPHK
jgi:hypothetical protein